MVVLWFSRAALREKLTAAFDAADVVITSGGVSMGEMVLIRHFALSAYAFLMCNRIC